MTEHERRLLLITARVLHNQLYDEVVERREGDSFTRADMDQLADAIEAVDPPKPPAPPPATDDDMVF
jgi:hypothetical protein